MPSGRTVGRADRSPARVGSSVSVAGREVVAVQPGAGRVRVHDQQRAAVRVPVGGRPRRAGRARSSVSVSAATSQISSSSRPRRSCSSSSRWSPGDRGERRAASRPLPGPSDFSATSAAVGHATAPAAPGAGSRRARSGSIASSVSSSESAPTPASSASRVDDLRPAPSPRRTARSACRRRWTCRPRRPCGRSRGRPGSRRRRCRARAGSGSSSAGRPANGSRDPVPNSSPSVSANHQIVLAVRARAWRRSVPLRPVGDLAVGVGRPVPGVDLAHAARVGEVDVAVRRVAGPVGPRHAGRGEPRPPALLALRRRRGARGPGRPGVRSHRPIMPGPAARPRTRGRSRAMIRP